MQFTVVVIKEEDWYVARDIISGVASQGKTKLEALNNLKEALELYFEDSPSIKETDFWIEKVEACV
ncbi:MAG: type II toxin-antitoxin system HicB family antitoxin [Lachnospiraceae bacterium]|nr:type II toxin-antitoxin system HicB family antitoxin [Lachnospiraceae bacterium]